MKEIAEKPVDINNEFKYKGNTYRISPLLKQYQVKNYPVKNINGTYNNWTNECDMDSVIIVDNGESIKFLDQKGKDVTLNVEQVQV